MMHIIRSNSKNNDFRTLTRELDADLEGRNGANLQAEYNEFNVIDEIDTVILAYDEYKAIGCACFKYFDPTSVELKRMYLKQEYRGSGIAAEILKNIELWAVETGMQTVVLETGVNHVQALHFYAKNGYEKIPNYEPYTDKPNSVCMKKIIHNNIF